MILLLIFVFCFRLQCWWWISTCHLLFWEFSLLKGLSSWISISLCKCIKQFNKGAIQPFLFPYFTWFLLSVLFLGVAFYCHNILGKFMGLGMMLLYLEHQNDCFWFWHYHNYFLGCYFVYTVSINIVLIAVITLSFDGSSSFTL